MGGRRPYDFSPAVKRLAATRVGWRCSKPDCRAATVGPSEDDGRAVNLGRACHICAASPEGPRYDPSQSAEERKALPNAIWLCLPHSELIDQEHRHHPPEMLREWKRDSELLAKMELAHGTEGLDRDLQPLRFSLIRLDESRCGWKWAGRFRRSPTHFGFHQRSGQEWNELGLSTGTHSPDPLFDVAVLNDGTRPLLIHRVGFLPTEVWTDLKGIPGAGKVPVLDSYELPVAPIERDHPQVLDLTDPVHIDPSGHFRFKLHLLGYREALSGNESVVRLLVESNVGVHHSREVYLGVY